MPDHRTRGDFDVRQFLPYLLNQAAEAASLEFRFARHRAPLATNVAKIAATAAPAETGAANEMDLRFCMISPLFHASR